MIINETRYASRALLAQAICFAVTSTSALATPLRMDSDVTDLGSGVYRYDFTLTLDNHDGTWAPGQQWDWIIFGDNDGFDTHNGFDTNGAAAGGLDWTTLGFASPISSITNSQGSHNGPTLAIDGNNVELPGWAPTSTGQFLTWSGTSHVFIPAGELFWSSIVVGAGAQQVNFEPAHTVAEPSAIGLLAVGLGLVGFARCFRGRYSQSGSGNCANTRRKPSPH